MNQLSFPVDRNFSYQKLYCYTNNIQKIVIAKINGLVERHCERIIFPGEKFLFKANENCEVEISQQTNTGIIKDFIPCEQLQVVTRQKQSQI